MKSIPMGIPKGIKDFHVLFMGDEVENDDFPDDCIRANLWFVNHYPVDHYFIKISIEEIPNLYDFPLVWKLKEGKKFWFNEPTDSFYVEKTGLLDLIKYYLGIVWTFKRG
jgi:hypothetical protein